MPPTRRQPPSRDVTPPPRFASTERMPASRFAIADHSWRGTSITACFDGLAKRCRASSTPPAKSSWISEQPSAMSSGIPSWISTIGWPSDGAIPCVKLGKLVRYSPQSLVRAFAEREGDDRG